MSEICCRLKLIETTLLFRTFSGLESRFVQSFSKNEKVETGKRFSLSVFLIVFNAEP